MSESFLEVVAIEMMSKKTVSYLKIILRHSFSKSQNKAAIKLPLRDGDIEREDEAYKGHFFINANSTTAPQIVDRSVKPILDSKIEEYSQLDKYKEKVQKLRCFTAESMHFRVSCSAVIAETFTGESNGTTGAVNQRSGDV